VLSPHVTDEILCDQLDSAKYRGRKAASLMLDQSAFAGLGNYLRSEILSVSGIHPDDRPRDLSRQDIVIWAHAIRTLGIRSCKTGGITVARSLEQAGKASGLPRSSWRHYVFNRVGKGCPNCGETIVRKRYGGRRLDFCQYCQQGRR
jgi:endonuclease-8